MHTPRPTRPPSPAAADSRESLRRPGDVPGRGAGADPSGPPPFGRRVEVFVETTRGSFVKRDWDGHALRVRFASPFPCPFDYGHVVGLAAPDGSWQDAIWFGDRTRPCDVVPGRVAAVARFTDGGLCDDKWVVTADGNVRPEDLARIPRFFAVYVWVKRLAGRRCRFEGILHP